MDKKILQMLGLCQRAGKLSSGETGCLAAIRDGSAVLVIVAEDASDNTKKRFADSSAFYKKNIKTVGNKSELGRAIGKDDRSVLTVNDSGFAAKICEMLTERAE